MNKNILLFLLSLICVQVWASAPKMFVYRNDSKFNQIEMSKGGALTHNLTSQEHALKISEDVKIPISAIDSVVIRNTDIPTVRITLTDYPEATMIWDKELYLDATIEIEGNGMIDDLAPTSLSLKGRGNSTWQMPKKPMRLKFNKKTQIGNLTKAKNYVLLNNYIDPTLMKNAIMMWLANQLGMPYSNHPLPCNVYMNGSYIGNYLMTEKVGINSGSVDIDEEKGMLFELSTEYDENYKFRSAQLDLPVMVKDPDFDELYEANPDITPDERLAMWQEDFNKAETLALNGDGESAFDVESFANYFLVCNLACNGEIGFPKSLYIYKKSLETSELYNFGPLWDFDYTFNYQ